jgi:protein-disulfide isomerase
MIPTRLRAAAGRLAATIAIVVLLIPAAAAQGADPATQASSAGEQSTPEGPLGVQTFDADERAAIERIVREYLLEHPEIIRDAARALQERERQAQQERQREAVRAHMAALHDPGPLPVLGNPDGDVTVVEFFDYNCPYCRSVTPTLLEAVEADGNVRLILKELPILRESSRMAARAAIASAAQGAYATFHTRLMAEVRDINRANVLDLAKRMGLDVDQLEADMDSRDTEQAIADTYRLAEAIGVGGTPAFVIGDTLVPGAVGRERLMQLIAEAREAG